MKFKNGVSVLLYWYEYHDLVKNYSIPAVFISDDSEGKAPFLSPENFDYPDWWYTWLDVDRIVRRLSRQDWALIIHYFKHIYFSVKGTFYRWDGNERFRDMCERIYNSLDDGYQLNQWGYRKFERVLARIRDRIERGEIIVGKIDPDGIYTVPEVSAILRYEVVSIHTLLKNGKLVGFKPGGHDWRITGQAILDLINADPKGVDDADKQ